MNLPPKNLKNERVYEGGNETKLVNEVNYLRNKLETNYKMQNDL